MSLDTRRLFVDIKPPPWTNEASASVIRRLVWLVLHGTVPNEHRSVVDRVRRALRTKKLRRIEDMLAEIRSRADPRLDSLHLFVASILRVIRDSSESSEIGKLVQFIASAMKGAFRALSECETAKQTDCLTVNI